MPNVVNSSPTRGSTVPNSRAAVCLLPNDQLMSHHPQPSLPLTYLAALSTRSPPRFPSSSPLSAPRAPHLPAKQPPHK